MLKLKFYILLVALYLFYSLVFAQEQITITTYYPSPHGSYNELGTNKLAVDITNVALPTEYTAMDNGDVHIGRSLIVGAGGGSGFAYDELVGPPDNRPGDGDILIKGDVGIGTTTPQNRLDIEGGVAIGAAYSGTNTAPTNGAIIEGNVGIGTINPIQRLDVNGKVGTNDSVIYPPRAGSPPVGVDPTAAIGELAYFAGPDAFYHYNGSEWVRDGGGGGCYVSYSGSCLAGFTNMGSAGWWGFCFHGYKPFRPPGGGCPAGWLLHDIGEAFVCCQ